MNGEETARAGLAHAREYTDRYIRQLREAGEQAWERATNCPPWDVRMLSAHVVRSAEAFATALERGARGVLEPAMTPEQRQRNTEEIAAEGRDRVLERLRESASRFERQIMDLFPDRLDTLGAHSYGPRSATWFVQQRLAELAFHLWDLRVSLGLGAEFDDTVARWLLPMLAEANLPSVYARAPREAGAFGLAVEGDSELAWTLRPGPTELAVTRGLRDAEVTIHGDAAALALLVYGRVPLDQLEAEGRVRISGDRALASRFSETFRGP
jgi:uncharacterized protein (TIGR03083 family)